MKKFLNKKTAILLVLIVLILLIVLFAFKNKIFNGGEDELIKNNTGITKVYAPASSSAIKPGTTDVESFLKLLDEKQIVVESKEKDNCFNVTPDFVLQNSEYKIFKFSDTAESFLMYQNEIYKIGNNKRGQGIVSFALADSNDDDMLELYYSFDWEVSQVSRSNVAYFDPATKQEVGLNKNYREQVVMLGKNAVDDTLCVYNANISNYETSTKMNVVMNVEEDVIVNHDKAVKLVKRAELEALEK